MRLWIVLVAVEQRGYWCNVPGGCEAKRSTELPIALSSHSLMGDRTGQYSCHQYWGVHSLLARWALWCTCALDQCLAWPIPAATPKWGHLKPNQRVGICGAVAHQQMTLPLCRLGIIQLTFVLLKNLIHPRMSQETWTQSHEECFSGLFLGEQLCLIYLLNGAAQASSNSLTLMEQCHQCISQGNFAGQRSPWGKGVQCPNGSTWTCGR